MQHMMIYDKSQMKLWSIFCRSKHMHSSGVYFALFSRFFFSDLFVSVFWQAEPYHCTLRKRKRSVLEKYISHDHSHLN